MENFKDKVAVITGAASGIGLGLARHCSKEKIKIVLADIEKKALLKAKSELEHKGADVTAVVTDVSKIEDIKVLAQKAIDTYGRVDLLFNNAGVGTGSSLWESSVNDCRWVIDVNIFGIINCIHEFVPIMFSQNTPCHIINTSSMAGLTTYHPSALYQLTKHSIVALSEQLLHDFQIRGANIKVSVICPGAVNTNIMDSDRNRPEIYKNDPSALIPDPMEDVFREMIKSGMSPSVLAKKVFEAIRKNKFYIITHPEMKPLIELRMNNILNEQNPVLPPKPTLDES